MLTTLFNRLFCRPSPTQPLPQPPSSPRTSNATTLTPNTIHPLDVAHHAMYGQHGETTTIRTLPTSWQNLKPFKKPIAAIFPWKVGLNEEQVNRLVMGFLPRAMEDKWMIYSEDVDEEGKGNLRISLHRSWTGIKIMEIWIEAEIFGGGEGGEREYGAGEITGLVWEDRDEDRGEAREERSKGIVREVCRWVLGVQLPEDKE